MHPPVRPDVSGLVLPGGQDAQRAELPAWRFRVEAGAPRAGHRALPCHPRAITPGTTCRLVSLLLLCGLSRQKRPTDKGETVQTRGKVSVTAEPSSNRRRPRDPDRDVVVVGAGPAGLAAAARLQGAGHGSAGHGTIRVVGAAWHTRRQLPAAYHSVGCPVPGMAKPPTFGPWVARDDFVTYLERYARRFNIRPQFGIELQGNCQPMTVTVGCC